MSWKHLKSSVRWTELEIESLKSLCVGGATTQEISVGIPTHSKRAVLAMRMKMGYSSVRNKYSHNALAFSTPDVLNSYWAGFLAADGSIDVERNRINLTLAFKDRDHLRRFSSFMHFDGPIHNGMTGKYPYCRVGVGRCGTAIEALKVNFAITERKTFSLMPPRNLDRECSLAYCVGLIDGDGSVFKYTAHDRTADRFFHRRVFSVVGTLPVIEYLRDTVTPLLGETRFKRNLKKQGNVWRFDVSGYPLLVLWQNVRDLGLPLLYRKWSVLSDWLTEEIVRAA